jgi:hypothetical protein
MLMSKELQYLAQQNQAIIILLSENYPLFKMALSENRYSLGNLMLFVYQITGPLG